MLFKVGYWDLNGTHFKTCLFFSQFLHMFTNLTQFMGNHGKNLPRTFDKTFSSGLENNNISKYFRQFSRNPDMMSTKKWGVKTILPPCQKKSYIESPPFPLGTTLECDTVISYRRQCLVHLVYLVYLVYCFKCQVTRISECQESKLVFYIVRIKWY